MRIIFLFLIFANILYANIKNSLKDIDKMMVKGEYKRAILRLEYLEKRELSANLKLKIYRKLAECYWKYYKSLPERSVYYWKYYFQKSPINSIYDDFLAFYNAWKDNAPYLVIEVFDSLYEKFRRSDVALEKFLFLKAKLYYDHKSFEKAEEICKEIYEYYQNEDVNNKVSKMLFDIYLKNNKLDNALNMVENMEPSATVLLKKAKIYEKKGDFLKVKELYENIISDYRLDNEKLKILYKKIIDISIKDFDHENTLKYISKLENICDDAEKERLILIKAKIYQYAKNSFVLREDNTYINTYQNFNEAKKIYERLIEKTEDPIILRNAYLELGNTYRSLFLYNKSVEILKKLIEEYPDSPEAERAKKIIKEAIK